MDTDPDIFIISAPVLMAIVSLIIPLVNGLITKYTLSSGIKGLITLALNAVAAFVVTATTADGTAVFSRQTLYTAGFGFVISVATYVGVYKPLNLTSSTPDGKLSPDVGLGAPSNPQPD